MGLHGKKGWSEQRHLMQLCFFFFPFLHIYYNRWELTLEVWDSRKQNKNKINQSGILFTKHLSILLQYPSFEVSCSLRFGACALEPAFGQVHTSLAWASLYPIDWGWACHWVRIKVLRLSIKGGRAMRGTCQRFVCCQGLVSARRRYGCRIAKSSVSLAAPKSLQGQTSLLPQ